MELTPITEAWVLSLLVTPYLTGGSLLWPNPMYLQVQSPTATPSAQVFTLIIISHLTMRLTLRDFFLGLNSLNPIQHVTYLHSTSHRFIFIPATPLDGLLHAASTIYHPQQLTLGSASQYVPLQPAAPLRVS